MATRDHLLMLSPRLVRLPDHGGVAHATLGRPFAINAEGWKLLELFRRPTTARAAAATASVRPGDRRLFFDLVERFVQAGFLVEPDEDRYLYEHGTKLAAATPRLLNAATAGFLGATSESAEADLHFIGVPFEHPLTNSGSHRAPAALRASAALLSCLPDGRTGRCQGLRHLTDDRLLLANARLCDQGDVDLPAGLSPAEAYGRIGNAARQVRAACQDGVPIFLGGDHSITEPILRGLAGQPLFVVQFDAHTDLYPLFRDTPHHHGNVMERLRRQDGIRGILQVGVRDLVPPWWRSPAPAVQIGATRAARLRPAALLDYIPRHVPCYVTIDIDVLDPAFAPATGAPLPGGLRLEQLDALLTAVGRQRNVVGVDLVEIAPDRPGGTTTLHAALYLLLRFCDALHARLRGSTSGRPVGRKPGRSAAR